MIGGIEMKLNKYEIQCEDESCKFNKHDTSLDDEKIKVVGLRTCTRKSPGLWLNDNSKCVLRNIDEASRSNK